MAATREQPSWCFVFSLPSRYTSPDLLVLLCLLKHANADGTSACPSVSTIAQLCRLSDRAVQRSLRKLADEKNPYIVVEAQPLARRTRTGKRIRSVTYAVDLARLRRVVSMGDSQSPVRVTDSHPMGDSQSPTGVTQSHPTLYRDLVQGPLRAGARDWFAECQELHGRSCASSRQHAHQMAMDRMRAERSAVVAS